MYNGNKITREQNKQWNNTGKHIKSTIATNWKLKKKKWAIYKRVCRDI